MAGDPPPPYLCNCYSVASQPFQIASPRVLPVNLPFPTYGITIATLDSDGNVTIKVDQPKPEPST